MPLSATRRNQVTASWGLRSSAHAAAKMNAA